MMSLQNKVALVTGSTSGIGLSIARVLASRGADIMTNGFGDKTQIEHLRAALASEFGVRVGYWGADISEPAQIAEMVRKTHAELGSLDILVNNAGIQFTANIEDFPEERWDAIIAINMSGVFHGMKAAIPGMKKRDGAESSISPPRMDWSRARRRSLMSRPNMAWWA
jgi:3-hydroxybutyrate dehydrogenase